MRRRERCQPALRDVARDERARCLDARARRRARARGVSRPSAVSSVTSREVGEDARGGTPRVLSDGYKRALAMWRAGAIDAAIEDFGTIARSCSPSSSDQRR